MKIAITGATGFIGQWMARKLLDVGHELNVLYRSEASKPDFGPNVEYYKGDVTNLKSLKQCFKGCDSVFHVAGLVGYSPAMRQKMLQVNVLGTQNVIDACVNEKVRKLLHFSSVVAIGANFSANDKPMTEDSEFNLAPFQLGYFETKRKAEELVKEAVRSGKLEAVMVNPSTVYGPGDATKGSRKTQIKVAQQKMPFYTSGGVNVIHIQDVVNAAYRAWEVGRLGERYILSNENISIKELFHIIAHAAKVRPPTIYLPSFFVKFLGKIGDIQLKKGRSFPLNSEKARTAIMYHWFDNSKAKAELGLKPRPAKEAIKESVQWMKDNKFI